MEWIYGFWWNGKQDIEGDAYDRFIDICFQYSQYFSLTSIKSFLEYPKEDVECLPELQPFRVFQYNTINDVYYGTCYTSWPSVIRVYSCCNKTKRILKTCCRSLFSWRNDGTVCRQEDLTFFRQDGSAFMEQMSHEGSCLLLPHLDEKVNDIIKDGNWKQQENKGDWIYSLWTAQRITPQVIPKQQLQHIESRRKAWESWPANSMKIPVDGQDKEVIRHSQEQYLKIFRKIYREKFGKEYT